MALGLALLLASAAFAKTDADSARQALEQEQARAEAQQDALDRLTISERALRQDLAAAEKDIRELEAELDKHERELQDVRASRGEIEAELEALTREEQAARADVNELLRQLWELRLQRSAALSQGLPAWDEADRKYVWTSRLNEVMDERLTLLREKEERLSESLARRREIEDKARAGLARVNDTKDKLLTDKLGFQNRLAEARKEKLSREQHLGRILTTIDKLNYDLSEALKNVPAQFSELRGRLPWPVQGELSLRFAPKADPPRRGIGLKLNDGAEVKAVAAGKVVHDDVLRGFGRVVIVLHGGDYYSLYAYLSESEVQVGRDVAPGEVLGVAGYYPQLQGPGLYFELRFRQKVINPEAWLAAG